VSEGAENTHTFAGITDLQNFHVARAIDGIAGETHWLPGCTVRSMPADPSTFNHITRDILAAAIEVHRTLGPGLLESTYLECLEYELTGFHLRFERQRRLPIVYKGIPLQASYRIDLIVENRIVVEVKSVTELARVHWAQVLTYLRLTGCPAGLLINFNVARVMDGVHRVLNPHPAETARDGEDRRDSADRGPEGQR
jgi:GxxExxY protein